MSNRKPLRVGIACYPSVGGSGVIATSLGVELARRGNEVHFISYERPFRLPADEARIHFHPVVVNGYGLFKYPDYTLPLSVEMARVSCEHALDIMHVHYAVPHATAAILARCMLPKEKQPKVITTLHGTDTTLLGRDPGYGPAILHALGQSDAVTAVSQFLKDETRRVIGFHGDIDVIYNFFQPKSPRRSRELVREELGVNDEVLILHCSNLRPVKRIDLLLQTIAKIDPTLEFKLLIVAGADFSSFRGMVAELGLGDRVVVRENVMELEEYLNASDLTLYTSETESFCLSILEGMFFASPSVAFRVGGIPEVFDDGAEGYLIPFGEVDALARAVEDLIKDNALRARFGAAAQTRARAAFMTDPIVDQYSLLYEKLLEAKLSYS